MIFLILHFIVCESYIFRNYYNLTQDTVEKKIDKNGSVTQVSLDNITIIGDSAFYSYNKLEYVVTTSSLKSIEQYAFYNCSSLISITFDEQSNLETIGNYAFSYCSNLKTIKLTPSLTEISSHLFEGCTELKSITIISNIYEIQDYAFFNCYNLDCFLYYGTVQPKVNSSSFLGCKKLNAVIAYNTRYISESFGTLKGLRGRTSPTKRFF